MWIDSAVFKEDMEYIASVPFIPWEKLKRKTILITGATGLIGHYLTNSLIYRNIYHGDGINILLLVRNIEKAEIMYEKRLPADGEHIHFIKGSMEEFSGINGGMDYIVHAASPTNSEFFVQHPVETVQSIVHGTEKVLHLAREKQVLGCVYLSSMEVYGANLNSEKIAENHGSNLDTMSVRSSYPEAKRLCENLCADYAYQYHVPICVLRLAQTFGPGIQRDDKRIFAQLMNAYLNSEDIVLLTDGKSSRSYIYLADAVTAILTVLLSGKTGNAYNAANESTYCSILDLAKLVAEKIAKNRIGIVWKNEGGEGTIQFPPPHMLNLDTRKLHELHWTAHTGLENMFLRTIETLNE